MISWNLITYAKTLFPNILRFPMEMNFEAMLSTQYSVGGNKKRVRGTGLL